MLLDGALTAGFDQVAPLLVGLGWLAGLTVAVAVVFRRAARPAVEP